MGNGNPRCSKFDSWVNQLCYTGCLIAQAELAPYSKNPARDYNTLLEHATSPKLGTSLAE
jgi:hypothetical protein